MAPTQSAVEGVVVSFAFHAARAPSALQGSCLTPHDRIDVTAWQERAGQAGFDRMVIHDRDDGDASEVGNFLSVYRSGQAWSRWGFARSGRRLRAWCCLTGADVGEFDSMADALEQVLCSLPAKAPVPPVATNLIYLPRAVRMGSAA